MKKRRQTRTLVKFIKGHKWAVAAVAAGVLLIAAALIPWGGGDKPDKPAAHAPTSRPTVDNGKFDPNDTGGLKAGAKSGTSQVIAPGGDNPFAKSNKDTDQFGVSDIDNKLHTVTMTATSDGAMNIGYRFRGGHGDGAKIASRNFSFTNKVRGGLPVSQIGVQTLSNGSYVTCSITIDGVEVSSAKTTKGPGYVVVCTA